MKLIDQRTADGSRHFARLSKTASWLALREHVGLLKNAKVLNFVSDEVLRPWLDFSYRGHRFGVLDLGDQLHLLVQDPQCCDLILFQVGCHFERLQREERAGRNVRGSVAGCC